MSKRKALLEDLRAAGDGELHDRLRSAREELVRLRFQQTSRQLSSPARLRQVRKEIAAIMTLAAQREAKG